jgi:hypothetical protein
MVEINYETTIEDIKPQVSFKPEHLIDKYDNSDKKLLKFKVNYTTDPRLSD